MGEGVWGWGAAAPGCSSRRRESVKSVFAGARAGFNQLRCRGDTCVARVSPQKHRRHREKSPSLFMWQGVWWRGSQRRLALGAGPGEREVRLRRRAVGAGLATEEICRGDTCVARFFHHRGTEGTKKKPPPSLWGRGFGGGGWQRRAALRAGSREREVRVCRRAGGAGVTTEEICRGDTCVARVSPQRHRGHRELSPSVGQCPRDLNSLRRGFGGGGARSV